MLDQRLSKPKSIARVQRGSQEKVFRNTPLKEQSALQSLFSKKRATLASTLAGSGEMTMQDMGDLTKTFDERGISKLNNSFYLNYRRNNYGERPQKLTTICQTK